MPKKVTKSKGTTNSLSPIERNCIDRLDDLPFHGRAFIEPYTLFKKHHAV
jgi:hypothetical protein